MGYALKNIDNRFPLLIDTHLSLEKLLSNMNKPANSFRAAECSSVPRFTRINPVYEWSVWAVLLILSTSLNVDGLDFPVCTVRVLITSRRFSF